MQSVTDDMESSVDIPKKLTLELPYDPSIPRLGIYSKRIEIRISRRNCYLYVHYGIIHNCQDVETI